VKIRGYRVELDEIETALKALPGVSDAVATQGEDEAGEKRVVAYVVADGSPARDIAQWRAALAEHVPAHVLPEDVVTVPAIPLSANGKIDARALAAAFARARAHAARPDDQPQSPTERGVAEIFAAVLGVAIIGSHDDFFAVGGHSLLAAQVIARIGERFAVELSLRDFLAGPTVADVARRIASAPPRAARAIRPPADAAAAAHFSDDEVDAMLAEAARD
jgi:acyl carrier protein